MGQHYLTFAFVVLLYASICSSTSTSTSELVTQARGPSQSWAYRCDTKIFSSESVLASVQDLQRKFQENSSHELISRYMKTIPRSYSVTGDSEVQILWPLIEPGQSLTKHGDQTSYYVVMENRSLKFRNVAHIQDASKLVNCVKEKDLSELSNELIATGFRCPAEIYSFRTIGHAISALRAHKKEKKLSKTYPARFLENSIFEFSGTLLSWPIAKNGNFQNTGLNILIVDVHDNVIGMVHKKGESYLRCRLTASEKIVSKFIKSALEMQLRDTGSRKLKIFQCGSHYYVRSDIALLTAAKAASAFILKRTIIKRVYPKFYEKVSHDDGLINHYLWPAVLGGGRADNPDKQLRRSLRVFLVIDDFCNIAGVIYKNQITGFSQCEIVP